MKSSTPAPRLAGRRALLHSVSATALIASAAAMPSQARAGSFRSINQALAQSPAANAAANINTATARAARQAALGAQNVATAAARFRSLAQALAGMSYTGAPVPDGIAQGGLEQAPGVAGSSGTTLWSGAASALSQTASGGTVDVTITQTAPVASLTWQTYNIGAHTKLIYNQSAGGTLASTWVAINRIEDPLANPTTILGQISAPGKVFILNPYGVLFGAGSQLNLGSLVASTASIAQSQLTTDTNGLIDGFSLYGATGTGNVVAPSFTGASPTASIIVQPGAEITTTAPTGTGSGGYVMLLADTVQNGGVIATPHGQTILAAGTSFQLLAGNSVSNPTATVIGSEIAVTNIAGSTLGAATNSGIVLADQGDVTMVGHTVDQAGVILATTTVDTRGTVHLLTDASDPTASVNLAANSITEIVPEDNGQTALNSQRAANLARSVTDNAMRLTEAPSLNDANTLADTLGESRIEISTGGSVTLAAGAMALAQGGQVAVGAGQSITLASGATVDVSGTNAVLPASADSLLIQGIVSYELRDSPGNRGGALEFANAFIDLRDVTAEIADGAYDGNIYSQGGLLELSGNLALTPHGIQEWSAVGGQVILQSAASNGTGGLTGGTVTIAQGATINLTGGTVTYQAGLLPQSYVQAADGEIFNINEAPGNLIYTSLYTGDVAAHPRWHITQTFNNPLLTPAEIYQSAYTIGRDAGSLTIASAAGTIAGNIDADTTVGDAQTGMRPTGIIDPFLLGQSVAPLGGTLSEGIFQGGSPYGTAAGSLFSSALLITGSVPLPPGVIAALPDSVTGTISIAADTLNAGGLADITIYTGGGIALGAPLAVADGGTVTLGAPVIEDEAGIIAHGGAIALTNLLPGAPGSAPAPIALTPGSITLAAGATLDASGVWTNLVRDPAALGGVGFAAGGTVAVIGTGAVDLASGSVLDVSSGGVLSAAGKLATEAGGSITVSADIVPLQAAALDLAGAVTLDAAFRGYATGPAGTLSLQAPAFLLGGGTPTLTSTVAIGDGLFSSGFGDYVLNGDTGLTVAAGAQIALSRPIYTLSDAQLPSGAEASGAYSVFTPGLFTQIAGRDSLVQRQGASLALEASIDPALYDGGGGAVTIGSGAAISVDPRQSITVEGYGQVTVLGALTAHGGTIGVFNTRYEVDTGQIGSEDLPSNYTDGLSVWIGEGASLDASGQAAIMTDAQGRRFGQSQAGGTILLGGIGGADAATSDSTYAQVILRPGAALDASGASATVDIVPGTEIGQTVTQAAAGATLAGNGGTIVARSLSGIALDGTMLAQGAGPGAAGGTLDMRIDPTVLSLFYGIPVTFYVPAQIAITQDQVAVQPGFGIAPGDPSVPATERLGRISQQQIAAGGFDALNLYAQDQIVFDGSVDLSLGRSLVLSTTTLGETSPAANVAVRVPYLSLFGYSPAANGGFDPNQPSLLSPLATASTLSVDASFIDIANTLTLGGVRLIGTPYTAPNIPLGGTLTASAYGFATTVLDSAGDIRFDQASLATGGITSLASTGNITLQGAQIYPATQADAVVTAGEAAVQTAGVNPLAGGTLSVLGQGGAAPQAPFSVGGTLSLIADTIVQAGVLRAPEGVIDLGEQRGDGVIEPFTDQVVLAPGSITSVSLNGQTVPYGGTVDGVNYLFAGLAPLTFNPLVQIASANVDVQAGATIDLSGGGTLSGAGFIAGRGGSADVNRTPLLNAATGTVVANTTDPVFAILPGTQSRYAPVSPGDAGYDTPAQGEQITIRAGEVPGLAAGTYTLLPAYFDLLPGAFRVELTGTPVAAGSSGPFGNFTVEAAVTLGTADTSVAASTPTEALITSGAGVRQLSQYNEESYDSFEAAQAATFDAPRPLLPQDAKTLIIDINTPTMVPAGDQPVSIGAASLLQTPQTGGYGATLEISAANPLEIVGPGDAVVPVSIVSPGGVVTIEPGFGLDAGMLSALDMPRLVIGGTLSANAFTPNIEDVQGIAPAVVAAPHADLTAGDIMLTADGSGQITVQTGATLSTIGGPATAYGQAQGIYFNSDSNAAVQGANPVLSLSNVQVVFTPNAQTSNGAAITVQAGASLQAGGSLDFTVAQGGSVQIGEAELHAAEVNVQVADINIGSTQALADFAALLPQGLALDAASLNTLAQGATQLSLTADEAVNILGSVALDSGSTNLVLNTPAIYGYGITTTSGGTAIATDAGVISITAPRFTWGGVAAPFTLQTGTATVVTATPGGRLAAAVVTNAGTETLNDAASLTIDAASSAAPGTIVLGYGPDTQVQDQVVLDRLAVGFASVTLAATGEITANAQSALSVFATQTSYGQPGIGGDLTLASPLITAGNGAVLDLTSGGTLSATAGGAAPASTGGIATLGATIALTAEAIQTSTAFALPSGKLSMDAADGIDVQAGTAIDLAGRAVPLFDQTAYSSGGTLVMAAGAGGITEQAGASIDVSSPGAAAGSVSAAAPTGVVGFEGSLLGTAVAGQDGGSFSISALALPAFDALNATLDAGGFTMARHFDAAMGDITVDRTVTAHTVTISADAGAITVSGTIDAAGSNPGSIGLNAATTLTLAGSAVLDARSSHLGGR